MKKIEKKGEEIKKRIPEEVASHIRTALLQKWEKQKEIHVFFPKLETQKFPSLYLFGVLSKDWPGLVEGVAGVLTELGWNIEALLGATIDYEGEKIAIFVLGMQVNNKEELATLQQQKKIIKDKLYKVCWKRHPKGMLLVHGMKKVEIYEEVIAAIKELDRGEEGVRAEATKFFDSRTQEYLEHRKPKDLAKLIITNYDFIEQVRKTGGKLQVKVKHLKTKKEKPTGVKERLTGATIACFNRDFSLSLVLDAIKTAVPDYAVRYNKEFITDEGISVYRIEIDGYHPIKPIEDALRKKAVAKKFDRFRLIEAFGGFEHYAKAIIPKLIKEHTVTGIPQTYISVGFTSEYFVQFKIIIVKKPSKGWLEKCTEKLDAVKGLSVLTCETPKLYGSSQVSIIDVRVDTNVFPETGAMYAAIKKSLEAAVGNFRDFDEGMRRIDVKKFTEIRQRIKEVNIDLLRQIYYGIEDFYRISAPDDEMTQIINLGVKLSESKPPHMEILEIERTCNLLGLVSQRELLARVLGFLMPYNTIVSKIQLGDSNLLLFRIEKDGKPLPQDEINLVSQKLTQILKKK